MCSSDLPSAASQRVSVGLVIRSCSVDGRFRAIQVKVHRSGAQVFARKGYRAIRTGRPIDAGSYEIPALALLDRTPLPNAFPVHAAGFSFPDPVRPGRVPAPRRHARRPTRHRAIAR